jgi:hypothetical protein
MSETLTTVDDVSSPVAPSPSARSPARPTFAHASEGELARILDFYQVRWEYEPHVFPILWNLDGAVVESFSPDFYLPDLELYLELTTLRQPLVRRKNRKLRRLRELYPDVRIKLFYARDFRALMLKYGKLGLADGLSGTSGQVPPQTRNLPVALTAIEPATGEEANVATPGLGPSSGRRMSRLRRAQAAHAVEAPLSVVPADRRSDQ